MIKLHMYFLSKLKRKVSISIISLFIILIGLYIFAQFTLYNESGIYSTALHEAGHSFMYEYYFPGSVEKVSIKNTPGLRGIALFIKFKGSAGTRAPNGITSVSFPKSIDKFNRDEYMNLITCMHAGYVAAMALHKTTEENLLGMYGATKDNEESYNFVLKILKLDGMIDENANDIENMPDQKAEEAKGEILYSATEEANKLIKENKKVVVAIADALSRSKDCTLNGDELRTIIKNCK